MKIFNGKHLSANGQEAKEIGEWELSINSNDIENSSYDFKSNTFSIGLHTHSEIKKILDLHPEEYTVFLSARLMPGKMTTMLLCYHYDTGFKPPAHKTYFCRLSGKEMATLASIIIRGLSFLTNEAHAENGKADTAIDFATESLSEIVDEIEAAKKMTMEDIMKKNGITEIKNYSKCG